MQSALAAHIAHGETGDGRAQALRRDLEDIPPAALEGIQFEFLKTVDEALAHALEPSEDSSAIPSSRSRARGERGVDTSANLGLRRR